jgi:hypothetical protein
LYAAGLPPEVLPPVFGELPGVGLALDLPELTVPGTVPAGVDTPPARMQPFCPQLVPSGQQNDPQQRGWDEGQ